MSISTRINNLKRITSKTVLIKKYLDILDEEYNFEFLYELFKLYSCSNKKFMAYSFADMIKDRYPDANEYIIQRNNMGDIILPQVTNTRDTNTQNNTIVTAANSSYFSVLLNCIASIHKNNPLNIIVYDLGLKQYQVDFLNTLKNVTVVIKLFPFPFFQWKFNIISDALKYNDQILYLDAGCYINKDLTTIFNHISDNSYILFDQHNDDIYKLSSWTTKEVYTTFSLDKTKCNKLTSLATIMGFNQDSKYIIDTVLKYNTNYLLRPHSSCIDNRCDQSLSSVIFKYILNLKFQPFEDFLDELYDGGCNNPYITIHYSKMKM